MRCVLTASSGTLDTLVTSSCSQLSKKAALSLCSFLPMFACVSFFQIWMAALHVSVESGLPLECLGAERAPKGPVIRVNDVVPLQVRFAWEDLVTVIAYKRADLGTGGDCVWTPNVRLVHDACRSLQGGQRHVRSSWYFCPGGTFFGSHITGSQVCRCWETRFQENGVQILCTPGQRKIQRMKGRWTRYRCLCFLLPLHYFF